MKFAKFMFPEKNEEKSKDLTKLSQIINDIQNSDCDEDNSSSQKREFYENDFIVLRTISGDRALFNMVIHRQSLHIFMMKKVKDPKTKEAEHEINFCKNYSHRCLNKFYGFLMGKGDKKIIGFIYKYLSNGPLSSFLNDEKFGNNHIFLLMIITRIFLGIEYLHKNMIY